MARRRTATAQQESLLEVKVPSAPVVPALRAAVAGWRRSNYKGATDTSKTLLRYWFEAEHRVSSGGSFRYHDSQRGAIETLIYLYEVVKIRSHKELLEEFAPNVPEGVHVLQNDLFPRYAVKMATGSGKTKVIALSIAWQFLNAAAGGSSDFARTFLLVAPNVIVFDRLRADFEDGRIFKNDPVVPPELRLYWDFDCYMRGESERGASQGALYLTNIQQLYERPAKVTEPEPIAAVLGPSPAGPLQEGEDFDTRIIARGAKTLVINDEAHHTHDEESEWNKVIRGLHDKISAGVTGQLDFSATPRYAKGGLFTWTVFDYPLKQAILDNVVKRPMKGIAAGIKEQPSDIASARYQAYLTAGVERWREYREQLEPLAKKPILFVMMNSTAEADDVGDYLRTKYPEEFAGEKLLVIHTDRSGEVSKKDLEKARDVARRVDEGESPVNAIVSVLMLREGWDVQNVTVVVGLRPYTAKANILPEQTIGRGLRLMFRGSTATYVERVDVIGNAAFLKFVEQLEQEEDLKLESFDLKQKLVITTVAPDPERIDDFDIEVPVLSPILARKRTLAEEIEALDVMEFKNPTLPLSSKDTAAQQFHYEGYDIITLEKLVERDYTIPEPQTAEEVISYYAKRIAQDVKLPSQFAVIVPKVRQFLTAKAFGQEVDLSADQTIRAISTSVAQYVTVKTFAEALRGLVVEELVPEVIQEGRPVSETPPFPWSRPTHDAKRSVLRPTPCDNEFEKDFALFLDATSTEDVQAFSKLPSQFGFAIEYTDSNGNLRYYEPDWVVRTTSDIYWLVETKGREDIDVAFKDKAAVIWCEHATMLTPHEWHYMKVPQKEWGKLQATSFAEAALVFEKR